MKVNLAPLSEWSQKDSVCNLSVRLFFLFHICWKLQRKYQKVLSELYKLSLYKHTGHPI